MTWPNSFTNRLKSPHPGIVFQVRGINRIFTPKPGGNLSARDADSGYNRLAVSVDIPGEAVEPRTWNPTHEGWSFEAVAPTLSNILPAFGRGKLVQLYFGFVDQNEADYQPIAFGIVEQIESITRDLRRWTVGGLGAVLGSRLDGAFGQAALFHDLPLSSTLSAGFTASSDASLSITSTTGLERETGGRYLVQVVPSSGDPFYLLGSAITATTFTIVDNTGSLGTTAVNASSNDVVNFLAYIQGHPVDVTRKILTSTGTGSNGFYDTLPDSWGLGITASLIDVYDLLAVEAELVPASGNLTAAFISAEPVTDPGSWLASYLQTMGLFITVRQGLITMRYAVEPKAAQRPVNIDVGLWMMRDAPISHVCYDERCFNVEYTQVTAASEYTAGTTSSSSEVPAVTMPAGGTLTYTTPVDTNFAAALLEIVTRLSLWAVRIPENLRVVTAGWYCAQICPGDVVTLSTNWRTGRPDQHSILGGTFGSRKVYVANVSPVLSPGAGFSTALELLILPETAG